MGGGASDSIADRCRRAESSSARPVALSRSLNKSRGCCELAAAATAVAETVRRIIGRDNETARLAILIYARALGTRSLTEAASAAMIKVRSNCPVLAALMRK